MYVCMFVCVQEKLVEGIQEEYQSTQTPSVSVRCLPCCICQNVCLSACLHVCQTCFSHFDDYFSFRASSNSNLLHELIPVVFVVYVFSSTSASMGQKRMSLTDDSLHSPSIRQSSRTYYVQYSYDAPPDYQYFCFLLHSFS